MDRDAALALLESQHQFPGSFLFRVVVLPAKKELTVSAMLAAAGDDARVEEVGERLSSKGNYLAIRVRIHLESAERVLDVYEVLNSLEHVFTAM
jgi:putative lipoic acid-binding regulatory protein